MKNEKQQFEYEVLMMNQMTIFDVLTEEKPFSWDDDINEIDKMILNLFETNGMTVLKNEFCVWDHVPQHGFRMDLVVEITERYFEEDFQNELENLEKYARKLKIKLDFCGAHIFSDKETGRAFVFSIFKDKRKRRTEQRSISSLTS